MADLRFDNIHKSFGETDVLMGVDLSIVDREFIVLLGPSGCGKSTLLRIIAGLEDQTDGRVLIGGEPVDHLPPAKRGIAMVFQSYALYPHLTVAGNWALGLKQAGEKRDTIDERVTEAARILELQDLLERKPAELSGGQRQRVAIGRAIVRHPKVFLFDEPLSNLDAALRSQVRFEIARLHKQIRATMVYVTHDQIEAMTLADRIVVLNQGKIEQVGSPSELYRTPANLFVAGFIGSPKMNFLPCRATDETTLDIGEVGVVPVDRVPAAAIGSDLVLGVRPDGFSVCPVDGAPIQGRVVLNEYLGRESYLHVELSNGDVIIAEASPDNKSAYDDATGLTVKSGASHLFDAGTGQRLAA